MHSVNRSTTVAIRGLCYLRKAVPKPPTHHKALTSSLIDHFKNSFYQHPAMSPLQKTRFLIISDTHNADRNRQDFSWEPFPKVDVVLHCGDLTMLGRMQEYQTTFDMIKDIDAELKLVIAGNHDISLDPPFYKRRGWLMQRGGYSEELPHKARALWCGSAAKEAGIFYLDEGVHSFTLKSGANLKVYASPYQPEFCDWAFPYDHDQDRFNPSSLVPESYVSIAENPIPSFPDVHVVMTHGPPLSVRDRTYRGEHVGCKHLLRAVARARPLLHCFGHIHEGYGAEVITWESKVQVSKDIDPITTIKASTEVSLSNRVSTTKEGAYLVDASSESTGPLKFGQDTLMVNASMMNLAYRPLQAPWIVDLDLPLVDAAAQTQIDPNN